MIRLPRSLLAAVLVTAPWAAFVVATPAPTFEDVHSGRATTPYYAFPTTWIAPTDANYQRRSEASAAPAAVC